MTIVSFERHQMQVTDRKNAIACIVFEINESVPILDYKIIAMSDFSINQPKSICHLLGVQESRFLARNSIMVHPVNE